MLAAAGCGSIDRSPTVQAQPPRDSIILHGAGAATAFPIYEEIGNSLAGKGITLNYQLTAGAAAMAQFRAGKVSFLSASGSRLTGNLPSRGTTGALYVPVGFTSVAIIYHLPGVHSRLRLSARTLAGIFQGTIRRWNSRPIARENRGVHLPSSPIAIVHDGVPTEATSLLSTYLAAGSERWRRTVGHGAQITWPGGTAEDTDALMQNAVVSTPGAIGYLEQPAMPSGAVQTASLLNPSDVYVSPSRSATTAVGRGPRSFDGLTVPTINAPVAGAYPIASETYVLVYRDLCEAGLSPGQAAATQKFLTFLLGPGQSTVGRLSFAPLPARMRAQAQAAVDRLLCQASSV